MGRTQQNTFRARLAGGWGVTAFLSIFLNKRGDKPLTYLLVAISHRRARLYPRRQHHKYKHSLWHKVAATWACLSLTALSPHVNVWGPYPKRALFLINHFPPPAERVQIISFSNNIKPMRNKRRGPHPFLEVTRTKFSAGHLLGKGSLMSLIGSCVYGYNTRTHRGRAQSNTRNSSSSERLKQSRCAPLQRARPSNRPAGALIISSLWVIAVDSLLVYFVNRSALLFNCVHFWWLLLFFLLFWSRRVCRNSQTCETCCARCGISFDNSPNADWRRIEEFFCLRCTWCQRHRFADRKYLFKRYACKKALFHECVKFYLVCIFWDFHIIFCIFIIYAYLCCYFYLQFLNLT
jgi:hypothetical protein